MTIKATDTLTNNTLVITEDMPMHIKQLFIDAVQTYNVWAKQYRPGPEPKPPSILMVTTTITIT